MIKIELSQEATDNLKSISDYISIDNPLRGKTYTIELLSKARKQLQTFPESCFLHNEALNIRRYCYGKYNLYYQYRKNKETVYILFVLHSAMAENEALKKKDYKL